MNIFVPIVLVGVLVLITLLLIIIDKLLGGGKEKILLINDDTVIPVKNEDTVLNTLSAQKIYVPSACGGKATCGFCKFRLIEGGGEVKPTELPFLSAEERDLGIRLSCQVKVKDNMKIEIPKELLNAQSYQTKVVSIEDQTYDIKLVKFKLINPTEMHFKPGQYAQIKVPGIDVIRAYSIASNPKDTSEIELIIRQVPNGQATTFVHKALEVGDKITLTGPFGDFYLRETEREMICIAGGSGKAPIRSILYYLRDRGMNRKVKYFFGAKSKRDLYMTEEFLELSKAFPNFEYIPALSEPLPEDEWQGEVGLITDVVDRLTDDLSEAEAYLCGSPGMINACNKILTKHDIKQHNVFYDKFS
ncbi:MAG: 2Fe-2S iron-sulfur cluster binding domain-containing protein [Acholeplasma sp.]|jgi:Na+-transporting NADH:ubiquinone oxidoreductase subunit F|nr:2Fe-2S iron-sulfur cluster binding domain-containing protein [Acholeplasma sp.]